MSSLHPIASLVTTERYLLLMDIKTFSCYSFIILLQPSCSCRLGIQNDQLVSQSEQMADMNIVYRYHSCNLNSFEEFY